MSNTDYSAVSALEPALRPWRAPFSTAPLDFRTKLPGSKSLTARELVLASLADGESTLRRPLHSRDSVLMVEALRALGIGIDEVAGDGSFGPDLRITPAPIRGNAAIDGGLAGTVLRFLAPLAALGDGPVVIDGDPAARRRPMAPVIDALRALGVTVDDDGRGHLPLTVHGTGRVTGGEIEVDASASSQFVSALLLAAPHFAEGLTLRHTGSRLPSLPHIEMTLACLRARGVDASSPALGVWRVDAGPIAAVDVEIEPDLSNAAPFLAAPLLAGGRVAVEDWPPATTQVGDLLRELLPRYGAAVDVDARGALVVSAPGLTAGPLPAVDLDLSAGGELAPTFAALAAAGNGPATIVGIGHLRGHETDRLAALAGDLESVGARVRILDDGLEITPGSLRAGPWQSHADHRMATTGALLGLAVDGVELDDIATTAKTLPEFPQLWAALVDSGERPA